MDARLDPAKALGLTEGDAHVIRNAGGRTVDALRSLVISQQLLGTREIAIVHHVRVHLREQKKLFTDDFANQRCNIDGLRDADFHRRGFAIQG